ncbi:hypothetical protein GCM10027521_45000 [Amycolatopsis cihanbeyliensis]
MSKNGPENGHRHINDRCKLRYARQSIQEGWARQEANRPQRRALRADEVRMDVVPVVFGSGKRYFGSVDAQHLLEDPDVVIQGNRVRR